MESTADADAPVFSWTKHCCNKFFTFILILIKVTKMKTRKNYLNQEKLIDGNLDGGGRPKANNVRRRCNICLLSFLHCLHFFYHCIAIPRTRTTNHFFPADCFRQTFTISLGLLRYATLALMSCFKHTFDVTVPRNMLSFRAMVEI